MTLSLELKHGRDVLTDKQCRQLAGFLNAAYGEVEVRLAGRLIIFDDAPPLKLNVPKPKRRKRATRKKRNATKRR